MTPRLGSAGIVLGLAILGSSWAASDDPAAPAPQEPRESGLVERTGRQLVQLDVTVAGPREAIADLTREDFEMFIGGRPIDAFTVDSLCASPGEARPEDPPQAPAPETPPAPATIGRSPTTFMFYFDQQHLNPAGRQRALDMSRELIRELIVEGNRGMLVSNGRELRTFADLTGDADALLRAVDAVEQDPRQWDPHTSFIANEESRLEEVIDALNDYDLARAISLARSYQREELWRTDRALRLFSMVLGRMADLDPPKAVIYFADTMRSNAGEHYLSFFGQSQLRNDPLLNAMRMDSHTAGNAFERVIQEATAHGIRMYPIQAEGLVTGSPRLSVAAEARAGRTSPTLNSQRIRDAQNSLVGMAMESGGRAFINGVPAAKVVKRIRADLACVYVASFDAAGLPRDRGLTVLVRAKRPKVTTQVRGRIVVQSESSRLTSRLLAGFAAPDAVKSGSTVTGTVVPTGFENGRFSALVQIQVPGSPMAGASWDLGVSLVSRGKVRDDASGRVGVSGPGVPVVFETEMTFAPGPYEIVSVAHETAGDQVVTGRLDGAWPDPNAAPVTVGPVAVMQPVAGAFLRDDDLRTRGALGMTERQPARTDRPTAMVGIVCRGRFHKKPVRVERRLVGDAALGSAADFDPMDLEFGDDRCVQIRDFVPAGVMTPGVFRYEVRVWSGEEELARSAREFVVAGHDEAPTPTGVTRS